MKQIYLIAVIIICTGNLYAQVNLDSGLVAYYPFNGNANDESGNGNDGTVFGAILTWDRFGVPLSAYEFDGVDDYIKADATGLPTGERTVAFWFFANDVNNHPALMGYGGGSCGSSWFMGLNAAPAQYNDRYYLTSHCNVNNLLHLYTTEPIGTWIHWAVTTAADGSRMYINGIESEMNGTFVNNTFVSGKDLSFGVAPSPSGFAPYTDGNISYFNGLLDEVRIYNRALTAEEIDSLYNEIPTSIGILNSNFPTRFELKQNYPNPFNPSTTIRYAVSSRQYVTLKIYDVLGNEVAILVNEEKPIGSYEVEFDATTLPSGIYFYRLQAGSFVETKKMLLLR